MKTVNLFSCITLICIFLQTNQLDAKQNNSSPIKASTNEHCYDENSHIINVGLGIGRQLNFVNYSSGNSHSSPSISITYEQPWKDRLGPGYLGVGAYLGFQSANYTENYYGYYNNTNTNYYYKHNWNYYMIASRATYHWDGLNKGKGEIYGGVIIGVRFQTYNFNTNDPWGAKNKLDDGFIYPSSSAFVGARWYFTKNLGVYSEVGYGISYLTGGLSVKF